MADRDQLSLAEALVSAKVGRNGMLERLAAYLMVGGGGAQSGRLTNNGF